MKVYPQDLNGLNALMGGRFVSARLATLATLKNIRTRLK